MLTSQIIFAIMQKIQCKLARLTTGDQKWQTLTRIKTVQRQTQQAA